MFVTEAKVANAEFREYSEVGLVVQGLQEAGYCPTLKAMLGAACKAASIADGTLQLTALTSARNPYRQFVPGDLFFKGRNAFVLQPIYSRLAVWEFRLHTCASEIEAFCSEIQTAAKARIDGRRLRGMNFEWKAAGDSVARRLDRQRPREKIATTTPTYSATEAQASRLLVSADVRSTLVRLAQVGKARSIDASANADAELYKSLGEHGLVDKEYLVTCRQDSHTICMPKKPRLTIA